MPLQRPNDAPDERPDEHDGSDPEEQVNDPLPPPADSLSPREQRGLAFYLALDGERRVRRQPKVRWSRVLEAALRQRPSVPDLIVLRAGTAMCAIAHMSRMPTGEGADARRSAAGLRAVAHRTCLVVSRPD